MPTEMPLHTIGDILTFSASRTLGNDNTEPAQVKVTRVEYLTNNSWNQWVYFADRADRCYLESEIVTEFSPA